MFPFSVSQFNDEFNRQMEVDLSNEIMKNREDVHLGYNKAKQRERDRELPIASVRVVHPVIDGRG